MLEHLEAYWYPTLAAIIFICVMVGIAYEERSINLESIFYAFVAATFSPLVCLLAIVWGVIWISEQDFVEKPFIRFPGWKERQ